MTIRNTWAVIATVYIASLVTAVLLAAFLATRSLDITIQILNINGLVAIDCAPTRNLTKLDIIVLSIELEFMLVRIKIARGRLNGMV